MRTANITPLLKHRMDELGLVHLQQLAARALITPDIMEGAVKGDRKITLNAALEVIKALNYEIDSEALLILEEIADQYTPTENEIRVKEKLAAERERRRPVAVKRGSK